MALQEGRPHRRAARPGRDPLCLCFTILTAACPSPREEENLLSENSSLSNTVKKLNRDVFKFENHFLRSGPEKAAKYVVLGEKQKVQLMRDSNNQIEITTSMTMKQRNKLTSTKIYRYLGDYLIMSASALL
ncbi:hypothetical protein J5N97_024764 [Dioscorea zingiberensis]|uniref:Uncharacterized protein n=1 Tax=Dioscorea zingiberensis TaxID=325984 RepID=A0A9D5H972_9LILI|nr:hypothetical protein J5N97_024764 [Dioscorea zingiberensis]